MSDKYTTWNPYNGDVIGNFRKLSQEELATKILLSERAFREWRSLPADDRSDMMRNAGSLLDKNREEYAAMISREMGKPVEEARAEVEKCAWVCDYYAHNAPFFLADEYIETDARQSFTRYDPLGTIFGIMPWNYPFWQVFRFAVPTLMAGNAVLLKHASNVLGSADQIENIFRAAGFPEGIFQSLVITHEQAENVIAHDVVKAISLTGSGKTGSAVAATAAKHLKKSVLELGGSNAFIVFPDADIEQAAEVAVKARFQNAGQSCIAAKRLIIVGDVYEAFMEKFWQKVRDLKAGDPMDPSTSIGPLARKDLADKVADQVERSLEQGAELLMGGKQREAYYSPTILTKVKPGMPAFDEEVFGPVAAVIRAADEAHAFELARKSSYGLGLSLFTSDTEKAKEWIPEVEDGAFFVNEMVKSDPRLPFGGTKSSGYGRELSREGILEFVNKKTVYIK